MTQIASPMETPTMTAMETPTPVETLSTHPPTTRRGKRSNNSRERIVDSLERRENERNKLMKTLLVEETEDEVDFFFRSLSKSVKKLPPALQQRAKAETLSVISRLETEMWTSTHYGSLNFSHTQNICSDTSTTVSPQCASYSDPDSSHHGSTLTELTTFSPSHVSQPAENLCFQLGAESYT